jgi:hypothetical protein
MDTTHIPNDSTEAARFKNAAEKQRRLAWEADRIAEADALIAAGYYPTSAEVIA